MCGICGKYNFAKGQPADKKLLEKMCYNISHRGPDETGIFTKGELGLGNARLCIVDPEGGKQPFSDQNNDIVITFDGEIYNFKELKEQYLKEKNVFRSSSDTEVIIHLYKELGEQCFRLLNGMFAFALWDRRKEQLYLVRDRIGIKPLFYALHDEGITFASALKAVVCDEKIEKKLNENAINDFFSYGYVPCPATLFENVQILDPGSYLLCKNNIIKKKKFSNINFDFSNADKFTEADTIIKIRERLAQAVKRQTATEQNMGILLSGGIDSSAIAYFAAQSAAKPLTGFCVGFKEKPYDQRLLAVKAAKIIGIEIKNIEVDINGDDILKTISYSDRLIADPAVIPMFALSRFIKKEAGINILLSGEGADELWAGYDTYIADKFFAWYHKNLPAYLRKKIIPFLADRISGFEYPFGISYKFKKFLESGRYDLPDVHLFWRRIFAQEERRKLFGDSLQQLARKNLLSCFKDEKNVFSCEQFISDAVLNDLKNLLPDNMLAKTDSMCTAWGIEVRVPFLDNDLLDIALKTPLRYKLSGLTTKYVFKKAMKNILPKNIIQSKKRGLSVPISRWIRHDLKNFVLQYLSYEKIKKIGLLNEKYIRRLLNEHIEGKNDNSLKIWSVLIFVIWHDLFIVQDNN